jgi:hypothetical protein
MPRKSIPPRTCLHCGKQFYVPPSRIREGKGKYCSRACSFVRRPCRPAAERFWEKVRHSDDLFGCWEWTASRDDLGYGYFSPSGGNRVPAHAYAYRLVVGEVPDGLELDHLCRNPSCVNPAHLEPVTHRENLMRGESPMAKNARKTHCIHGHPFSGDNLYIIPSTGDRMCKTCARIRGHQRAIAQTAERHALGCRPYTKRHPKWQR